MDDQVVVCEVGPRDGLQMAHTQMRTATKIRWIRSLSDAGLPEIEVGSFVPARVIPQMSDTAEAIAEVGRIAAWIKQSGVRLELEGALSTAFGCSIDGLVPERRDAPGASGNVVTEDLVFMLESMGMRIGVDLDKLLEARAILAEGLPNEPRHGGLARAGVPRTFRAAAGRAAAGRAAAGRAAA